MAHIPMQYYRIISLRFIFSMLSIVGLMSNRTFSLPTSSSAYNVPVRTLSSVIYPLQLLLNNNTLLQFRSLFRVTDITQYPYKPWQVTEQISGDLLLIDDVLFNRTACAPSSLPARRDPWFALVNLDTGCSSLDVVVSILKSVQPQNKSALQGFVFYMNKLDSIPVSYAVSNSSDGQPSLPFHGLILSRESSPGLIPKCSGNFTCTVVLFLPSDGVARSSPSLWVHLPKKTEMPIPPFSSSSPQPRTSPTLDRPPSINQTSAGLATPATRTDTVAGSAIINAEDAFLNRSSVLFVAVSFILLMFISLAWLVFYYVQRFRYLHSKERASRRLAELARKAVARIPLKLLRVGDKEIGVNGEHCAICIDPYKPFDNIRILPCRHYFHKVCIDPWLLEQRSCPMCKLDILQAYDFRPDVVSCPASTVAVDDSSGLNQSSPSQTVTQIPPPPPVNSVVDEEAAAVQQSLIPRVTIIDASAPSTHVNYERSIGARSESWSRSSSSRIAWFRGLFRESGTNGREAAITTSSLPAPPHRRERRLHRHHHPRQPNPASPSSDGDLEVTKCLHENELPPPLHTQPPPPATTSTAPQPCVVIALVESHST